jgi:(p)ppGpp synthase/HD superfamily hydrolase
MTASTASSVPSAPIWSQDRYVEAARFAAEAHRSQTLFDSGLPYLLHVTTVATEVMAAIAIEPVADPDLAVLCALMHDTIEDCGVTVETLTAQFGPAVAAGVLALSKDPTLPRDEAMPDSLRRIQLQPREVWLVKLADRINNLEPPPSHWKPAKIAAYRAEASTIVEALGAASPYLEGRLRSKIAAYPATATLSTSSP